MSAKDGDIVDHINGDPLDNRRENLRVCSALENSRNRAITGGTSKYKGVSFDKSSGLWCSYIRVDGILKNLGSSFESEEEAALCYNAASREYFGEFSRLNPLPETGESWQEISIRSTHQHNKRKYKSMYLGVSQDGDRKPQKWRASFTLSGNDQYLGLFKSEIIAAQCVDAAIYEAHGDNRPRNFPNETPSMTLEQFLAFHSNKSSRYIGVKKTLNNKWSAQISPKGVYIHIGIFSTEIAAALARDNYVKNHNIDRVKLNFPEGLASE